jgi:hypothetical protein
MTTEHPITPPPGLIKNWCASRIHEKQDVPLHVHVAIQAARWGADQELEACVEWASCFNYDDYRYEEVLRDIRRSPKPPSLKEQALEAMRRNYNPDNSNDFAIIRRALEQLDD